MPVLFPHCIDSNYHLGSFAFNQRTYFSISCKEGWVTLVKSFSVFVDLGMLLFCLHFWETAFLDIRILTACFFLQHFKYMIPQHSGLTCSDEKSVLTLTGSLIYTMSFCSCCFEDFFLCLLAVLILCVSVWIWINLSWICKVMFTLHRFM